MYYNRLLRNLTNKRYSKLGVISAGIKTNRTNRYGARIPEGQVKEIIRKSSNIICK